MRFSNIPAGMTLEEAEWIAAENSERRLSSESGNRDRRARYIGGILEQYAQVCARAREIGQFHSIGSRFALG